MPLIAFFAATLLPVCGTAADAVEQKSGFDSDSCLSCHEEIIDMETVHEPASDEAECTVCHEPSGKKDHSFDSAYEGADLCFQCHSPEDFEGESLHTPAMDGDCLACHTPHSSDNEALLSAPLADLCFNCHEPSGDDSRIGGGSAGRKNGDIETRRFTHEPFSNGDCMECHFPHAGENSRLLTHSYPGQLYFPYGEDAYEICFKCHPDIKDSLTEPGDASGTEFRNGDLNLHFVHVNKKKGRSCRICHQHHESTNRQLIRQTLPFGKKLLDMGYVQTKTGGTCSAPCHFKVTYDRSNSAANPMASISKVDTFFSDPHLSIDVANIFKTGRLNVYEFIE